MKISMLIYFTVLLHQSAKPTLAELHTCYQQAGKQEVAAEKLNQLVKTIDTDQSPVLVGYKGANEMIQAKYAWNPFTKLSRFNRGKNLLQMVISHDTANLEVRFLRFSIQSNIPSFLNYNQEITSDKRFLIANTRRNTDQGLKQMIVAYFMTTGTLTNTELNHLKN